jgi:hypothetical protein
VINQLEEKVMKSLITVVAALAISSGSLCFAADRGANVYNLQMLHSSGGAFSWQEMGSGVNQFNFSSYDYSDTFEMAFVIEGSVDINLGAIDGLAVHAISGGPAPSLVTGDVTFTDGYYVFSNTNTASDEFEITTPGVSPFTTSDEPLWIEIHSSYSDIHWQHRNGQLVYEFTGTHFLAEFSGILNHSSGPSDEECFWFGSIGTSEGIVLPTEAEQGGATIPAGKSSISCGFADVPYRLVLSFGEEAADPLPEDINGDGVVNVEDLLMLIAAWGSTSP